MRPVLLAGALFAVVATFGAVPVARAAEPDAATAAPACRANPLGTRALYLRGDYNQWAADETRALRWACNRFEGVVTLTGETRFKLGDEGWSPDADFGAPPTGETAATRVPRLAPKGRELTHAFHGTHRIVLDMSQSTTQPTLAISDCPTAPTGGTQFFLRGSLSNWTALDEYAFTWSCDAYYLNVELQGRHEFKVADSAWTPATTYGAGATPVDVAANTAFSLASGDAVANLANLAHTFNGAHTLRLAFPGGMPTLGIGPVTWADPSAAEVDDPIALSLRHDSRALSDRTPFGAVTAGTEVAFALNAAPGVEAAWLVLESRRLEGNQDVLEYTEVVRLPMRREPGVRAQGESWHARHRFDAKGVVGYWFLVRIGGKDFAYQNNRDGVPWTREKGSNGLGRVEAFAAPAGKAAPTASAVRRYRLTVYDPAFTVPEWAADAVYYYIFPDRFRNGDPSNDAKPGKDTYHDGTVEFHANWMDKPWKPGTGDGSDARYSNDFFGGDIAGIIEKLDDIASLGANALYITPLFHAASNHKYDTADYHTVDPRFGSNADFARLAAEAKKRGIRLIPDTSLNHVGQDSKYFDRFGNFGGKGAFANGRINPDSPWAGWFTFDAGQKEPDKQYKGWVGIADLPELDKNSKDFRKFAYGGPDSVMLRWLDAGAAGWRMDVAPWVPDDFWREWRTAIKAHQPHAVTIAETWFDASKYFLGDMFDSTMNYIFRNTVLDIAGGADAAQRYAALELVRENYPPPAFHALMNLLSTHDAARSLHVLGWKADDAPAAVIDEAKQRFMLALFFQATYPGAPTVFYGDEVGVTGGDDPYNRVTYPWPDRGGKPDLVLRAYVQSLLALRKANPVLSRGTLGAPLLADAHHIVLPRRLGGTWAITAVSNATEATVVRVPLPADAPRGWRRGEGGPRVAAEADGTLVLSLPPLSGVVLFAD
jgi:cyclomaltodextrinase